jgi:hypothetical protein
MFLQNIAVYLQVHMVFPPRRPELSYSQPGESQISKLVITASNILIFMLGNVRLFHMVCVFMISVGVL